MKERQRRAVRPRRRASTQWWLMLIVSMGACATAAAPAEGRDDFGAVLAPASLPERASSLYGFAGSPELGVGFRQGIAGFELETRLRVDYLRVDAALEAIGKREVFEWRGLHVAPGLGLGVVFNTGATYYDVNNFSVVFARLLPQVTVSYRLLPTVHAVGTAEVPIDLGLSESGARRIRALTGGGAEVYLGEDVTALALVEIGVDVRRTVERGTDVRLGYTFRLGLGFRLF